MMTQHKHSTPAPTAEPRLNVPSKSDFLEVLQNDCSRAGMQLEWVLDRCDRGHGNP